MQNNRLQNEGDYLYNPDKSRFFSFFLSLSGSARQNESYRYIALCAIRYIAPLGNSIYAALPHSICLLSSKQEKYLIVKRYIERAMRAYRARSVYRKSVRIYIAVGLCPAKRNLKLLIDVINRQGSASVFYAILTYKPFEESLHSFHRHTYMHGEAFRLPRIRIFYTVTLHKHYLR